MTVTFKAVLAGLLLALVSVSCRGPVAGEGPSAPDHSDGIPHYAYTFHASRDGVKVSGTIGQVRSREEALGLLDATRTADGGKAFTDVILGEPPARDFWPPDPESWFPICSWMRDPQGAASSRPPTSGETRPTSTASAPWPFYRIYRVDRYAVRERIDGVSSREEAIEIISGEGQQGIRLLEEEMTADRPPEWPTPVAVVDQIRTAAQDPSLNYRQLLQRVSRDARRLPDSVKWSEVVTYVGSLGRAVQRNGDRYRIVVGGRPIKDTAFQEVFIEFQPVDSLQGTLVYAHAGLRYELNERADQLLARNCFAGEPLFSQLLTAPTVKSETGAHLVVKSIEMDDLPMWWSSDVPDSCYRLRVDLGDDVASARTAATVFVEALCDRTGRQEHPRPTDPVRVRP